MAFKVLALNMSNSYTFSCNPNGESLSSYRWSVKGDLEIVDATGLNITVRSKDKNSSDNSAGYGKGRIIFHYATTVGCGDTSSIDVYKTFNLNGSTQIYGPTCINLGDSVVYSHSPLLTVNLDDMIGTDTYAWSSTGINDSLYFFSGDVSSYTLKIKGFININDTIKIAVGRCNMDESKLVKLPIYKSLETPILTKDTCVSYGQKSINVKIKNFVSSGVDYEWSVPSQYKKISFIDGTLSLMTDYSNPGTVHLEAHVHGQTNNSCYVANADERINRSLSNSSSIIGTSCVDEDSTYEYKISTGPVNADYSWTLPDGWNPKSSTDIHGASISVVPSSTAKDGKIYVTVNPCNTEILDLPVYVKPAAISEIHGASCIDKDSPNLFYIDTTGVTPRASSYAWTVPSGWTITKGNGTDSIYAVANSSAVAGNISVTPHSTGGCNGNSTTLAVSIKPTKPDYILNLDSVRCINSGMSDTITVKVKTPVAGQMYDWVLPNGWSIVDNANVYNSQIRVRTNGTNGTFTIGAFGVGACENTAVKTQNVTILGDNNFTITYSASGMYTVAYNSTSTYKWWLVHNNTLVQDGIINAGFRGILTDPTLGDISNSNTYTIVAEEIKSNGCKIRTTIGAPLSDNIELNNQLRSAKVDENGEAINLFPNPTVNNMIITFPVNGLYKIMVVDLKGILYSTLDINGKVANVDVSTLPSGNYMVIIIAPNYRTVKKFLKE